MTHVYTTLVPMPFDKLDHKHSNESKPFQVLVCIHPKDSDESWIMLTQLMENINSKKINYDIRDIKTFGIVHSYARSTTSRWNATVIVGGFAHIANYWLTNGLIAGSTLGIEFKLDATGIIKNAQVCVVPPTATSMLTYSDEFTTFVTAIVPPAVTKPVYIKIATYHGGTSPYLVDGFVPGTGHDILFRDPIQVVACQNSSFEVYKPV